MNFGAGPAALPKEVLQRAREELIDFEGSGISVMEHSHRSDIYGAVHHRALELVRSLLEVPSSYSIFFVQGGASGMFATVPLNFLPPKRSADYIITGIWSKKALAEAQLVGSARAVADTVEDGCWYSVPSTDTLALDPRAAFAHITTNNTISGVQWPDHPHTEAPLIADASSDLFSRPFEINRFGMIYAGAQKNLGPSGVVLGIVRNELLETASTSIPKIFRFGAHVEAHSLLHTPPTFAIYLVKNVLQWLADQGGVKAIAAQNQAKANLLYSAIDSSDGWYRSRVKVEHRSAMNVVFRCPTEDLEARLLARAQTAGLIGLKGHRTVGGLRASIYNAVPLSGVERLVELMADFRREHA